MAEIYNKHRHGAWKVVLWELPDWALNGPAPGRPLLSPLWMLEGGMWSRR